MDQATKILLGVLAAGIWVNAAAPLIQNARAQNVGYERQLESIQKSLESIDLIARGMCLNKKIC